MGEMAVGNFRIGSRHSRGGTLDGLAQRNNLRLMSTLFPQTKTTGTEMEKSRQPKKRRKWLHFK